MPLEQSYSPYSPEQQNARFFFPSERGEIPVTHLNYIAALEESDRSEVIATHTEAATEVAESAQTEVVVPPEALISNMMVYSRGTELNRDEVLAA